jgi:hypothetical protein
MLTREVEKAPWSSFVQTHDIEVFFRAKRRIGLDKRHACSRDAQGKASDTDALLTDTDPRI